MLSTPKVANVSTVHSNNVIDDKKRVRLLAVYTIASLNEPRDDEHEVVAHGFIKKEVKYAHCRQADKHHVQ